MRCRLHQFHFLSSLSRDLWCGEPDCTFEQESPSNGGLSVTNVSSYCAVDTLLMCIADCFEVSFLFATCISQTAIQSMPYRINMIELGA